MRNWTGRRRLWNLTSLLFMAFGTWGASEPAPPPSPALEQALIQLTTGTREDRLGAIELLKSLSHPAAVTSLLDAASQEDQLVRLSALGGLTDRRERGVIPLLVEALAQPFALSEALIPLFSQWGDEALPALSLAIHNPKNPQASQAVRVVGRIPGESSLALLMSALEAPNPALPGAAQQALVGRATEALPRLLAALGSPLAQVRLNAAWAIKLSQPLAIRLTLAFLHEDTDPAVRLLAVETIAELVDTNWLPVLAQKLADPHQGIQDAAAAGCSKYGPEILLVIRGALRYPDAEAQAAARRKFDAMGADREALLDRHVKHAAFQLTHSATTPAGRREAVKTLGFLASLDHPHALDALLSGLAQRDPGAMYLALGALEESKSQAIPALTLAWVRGQPIPQWASARALGYLGARETAPLLLTCLRTSRAAYGNAVVIREAAMTALVHLRAPEVLQEFLAMMKDPVLPYDSGGLIDRGFVLWGGEAWTLAAPLVDHPLPVVRLRAINLLGSAGRGHPHAFTWFRRASRDTDVDVRRTCYYAIVPTTDPLWLPILSDGLRDADANIRHTALTKISWFGERALPDLMAALGHQDPTFVNYAMNALVALTAASVRTAIVKAAGDPSPLMRQRAVQLLTRFTDPGSLRPIVKCLHDTDPAVRQQALDSLLERRALPELTDASVSSHAGARRGALAKLVRFGRSGLEALSRALAPAKGEDVYGDLQFLLKDPALHHHPTLLSALLAWEDDWIPSLDRMLGDPDEGVRRGSVWCLSAMGRHAIPALKRAAQDGDPVIHAMAEEALIFRGEVSTPLIRRRER